MLLYVSVPAALCRKYNLADGSGVTWKTYMDRMADGLGLPHPWIDLPSGAARALAGAMEAPHRFLKIPGRPLLTRHAVCLLARDQEYPNERARRELGFRAVVGFDEGMTRTVSWLSG
jgi:nucleoside-diphosphate-sugar epimerase